MVYDGCIDANMNSDAFVPMIILPYVRSNCSALPCIHTDSECSFFCRLTRAAKLKTRRPVRPLDHPTVVPQKFKRKKERSTNWPSETKPSDVLFNLSLYPVFLFQHSVSVLRKAQKVRITGYHEEYELRTAYFVLCGPIRRRVLVLRGSPPRSF